MGGLGFGLKWDMGWMHDTLEYMRRDPIHRTYHHNELTFRAIYAFTENYMLPLSHDEVVHGKGSILNKMPGDEWQQMANLRLLLGYMFAQPGKKLLFMGTEFGQGDEWRHDSQVQWDLLQYDRHRKMRHWVGDLNRIYRQRGALHSLDCVPEGFSWIDGGDARNSVLSFMRHGRDGTALACVGNFTPVPRPNYRIGVPKGGRWKELLNSDAPLYGGSGQGNLGVIEATPVASHGRKHSLTITVPPLTMLMLAPEDEA